MDLHTLCAPLLQAWPRAGDVRLVGADRNPPIDGLAGDSRKVSAGDLFVATPGALDDGVRYARQAAERGAVAILGPADATLPDDLPYVAVPDPMRAKALVADHFFGRPSSRLQVIGITGTNGKTTTAFMLRSMLAQDGRRTGMIGTLGRWIGEAHGELANTTPDAIESQRLLAQMVDDNVSTVVMEVSSHGLAQHRVTGIRFAAGVFTNLSRDHLDYHGTMEEYAAIKGRLFASLSSESVAVLNAADPVSRDYAEQTEARVLRYGLDVEADARATVQRMDADGAAFRLTAPELEAPAAGARAAGGVDMLLATRLVGRHNVTNAVAAATTALACGVPPTAARLGLASLAAVPGRLEPIDCGQDFRVLVDYAHTPDALEQVLSMLRPLTRGRLLVVFGCGGDRDRTKRPLMGAAVARAADELFVTSDNPRGEDPVAILDDVVAGLGAATRAHTVIEPDRAAAIAAACRRAQGGDIVLIAGKGHETTQILSDRVIPFDDREVAREVLWSL